MKKLFRNLLFLSAIGSVGFLYSCGGDDEVVLPAMPSIEVDVEGVAITGNAIAAIEGDTADFTITVTAPGVFNTMNIYPSVNGTAGTVISFPRTDADVTLSDEGKTAVINISYAFTAEDVDTEITWRFEGVDDSDQTAEVTFTATVEAPPSPEARAYTAVLLYAPLADESSEIFFSTSTGETFSPDDVLATTEPVSGTLDFGYYHGANDGASLASIAAYAELSVAVFAGQVSGFGTKNATAFKETTLNASAFTEVTTWADIDEVFDGIAGDGQGVLTGLEVGQVIAFQTDADKTGGAKKGLILVKTIEGTFNQGDYIELEILVQEEAAN